MPALIPTPWTLPTLPTLPALPGALSPLVQAGPTYGERQLQRAMEKVPLALCTATDLYAGTVCTLLPPATPAVGNGCFPVSAILGAAHGIYGLTQVWPSEYDTHTSTEIARGTSHIITGLGFAGLALGMGAWALPVICIGEVASLVTELA